MKIIVQIGKSVLRKKAVSVPVKDISTKKIGKILGDMKKALAAQKDGVALAAPQVGIPLRVFVVSGKAWGNGGQKPLPDRVFINPVITKRSKKQVTMDEGCLSVRGKYGKVKRSATATVYAYDEYGKRFTYTGKGLLAQIFQHETDHLDGVLFIDKATDVKSVGLDTK